MNSPNPIQPGVIITLKDIYGEIVGLRGDVNEIKTDLEKVGPDTSPGVNAWLPFYATGVL